VKDLWDRYFAGVRWVELLQATILAFVGYLYVKVKDQAQWHITQEDLLQAGGAALSAAWLYLRMPKAPEAGFQTASAPGGPENESKPLNLPPKLDPTELIVQKLVALGYPEALARSEIARDLQGMAASVGVNL
jgi:hypothetical protein